MDIVYIEGLAVETVIGVYERERNIKQTLIIDLEFRCDTKEAGLSDDFKKAIDYDRLSQLAIEHVSKSSYQLIESVAENLAIILLPETNAKSVRIKVSKPGAVSAAKDVGVIVERSKTS